MTWSSVRQAAERRAEAEQPALPERRHEAPPSGAGTTFSNIGGRVRDRQTAAAETKEIARVDTTTLPDDPAKRKAVIAQWMIEANERHRRLMAQGAAKIERVTKEAAAKAEADRVAAKAKADLKARRAEFEMEEILLAGMYSDNMASKEEIQAVNQAMLDTGKVASVEQCYVALMELRARK